MNEWKQRDPIATFQQTLRTAKLLHDEDWEQLDTSIAAEVTDAVAFAEAGPWESVEELTTDVYSRIVGDQERAGS